MHFLYLLSTLAAAATVLAGRSWQHAGRPDPFRAGLATENIHAGRQIQEKRAVQEHQFLNDKTSKYAVNGSSIPDVDFDVGESYAGLLPVSDDEKDKNNTLYWWFFPSTNPAASKEIVIWLNGGPGCSSLEGFLQENGPFLWQYGTYKPVANPWGWHKLTNMVWIEQPIGTGFSTGTVTAENEDDIARQFLGFWKNFIELFDMQGYKVYITGESYAGLYCPYIASAMLDKKDTTYYNMSGMLIYDPLITAMDIQAQMVAVPFIDCWAGLHPFNNSFTKEIHEREKECGFPEYREKYLQFPPPEQQPAIIPGQNASGVPLPECEAVFNDIIDAALLINPCWDIYQVATTCPLLWDVLGYPGSMEYLPKGASIYFDRNDVKRAINAPVDVTWATCNNNVFLGPNGGVDNSPPSTHRALPHVIDATQNVIIAHGALDYVLIANGTLLGIQNMTWGGKLGFQSRPSKPFFVPFHDEESLSTVAASGVMGTVHTERGLTYVGVSLSGHMVPQYAPTAAYRHLEFLLGRVKSLSGTEPFTTNMNVTQPSEGELGVGIIP